MNHSIMSYNLMAKYTESNVMYSPHVPYNIRLPKIISRIKKNIIMKRIICLQEVDLHFKRDLDNLFIENNYTYHHTRYGRHGLLIAYPNDIYTEVVVSSTRIGSAINNNSRVGRNASSKKNHLMILGLEYDSKTFLVFNYHVPLCNINSEAMLLHIKKIVEIIEYVADDPSGSIPYILCVDLNNTPDTENYKYIASKMKDTRNRNYSHSVNSLSPQGVRFRGCLDYIFTSNDNIKTNKCIVTPAVDIIPSHSQGSDHTPIIAEFTIL